MVGRRLAIEELAALAADALTAAGTDRESASLVGSALADADADGLASHGVSRVPFYADQVISGKVNGRARPGLESAGPAAVRIDARDGFAVPAIFAGLERGIAVAAEMRVAAVTIANSHHCGVAGYYVEHAARHGLLAIGLTNTPAGIAPWGGHVGSFGTNPIAFGCPRRQPDPLVVDLSLSRVARGKIMLAQRGGEPIPSGWALDADGKPTTDPDRAMDGTMIPIGDAKGSALALMVEILTAGLSGSQFAFEASSFFSAEGAPPRIGQSFILIEPKTFAGGSFLDRIEVLLEHVGNQAGVRLPGARRLENRRRAREYGVDVAQELYEELRRRGDP